MQALHRVAALMTSSLSMSHHTRGSRQDIHSGRVPVRGEAVGGPNSLTSTSFFNSNYVLLVERDFKNKLKTSQLCLRFACTFTWEGRKGKGAEDVARRMEECD